VQFKIIDSGIGMSKEVISRLFKAFEQGSNDVTKVYGGTGLGLSISKNIINLFGGDIEVQSLEDRGSCFEFSIWLPKADIKDAITGKPSEKSTKFLEGKRALLVDDVNINRVIVREQLKKTGMLIEEADDGDVAIERFKASPEGYFDVVFMDIQMPRVNGYEACRGIRTLDRGDARKVTIIAMTANAFKEDVEAALENGMNAHLAKPLEMKQLLDLLYQYLHPADA
jgi:CheY-like chemotaxis protein